MNTHGIHDLVELKISTLSNGIRYDQAFLESYAEREDVIGKRRAYGNSDRYPEGFSVKKAPPEFTIGPFSYAVNFNEKSYITLSSAGKGNFVVILPSAREFEVNFTSQPQFYSAKMTNGSEVKRYATVYGKSTIGFFTPGVCHYFATRTECAFCSLKGTRRTVKGDISNHIRPAEVREAIERIAELDGGNYDKVMLSGGNLKDHDMGFTNHIRIAEGIRETCDELGLTIHLITMPPNTESLIDEANCLIDKLVFDPEIFDEKLMNLICPGKAQDFGRAGYERSLTRAVNALGVGKVHAGLVAGLESIESLVRGFEYYSALSVIPAANIFHPDPGTALENMARPSPDFIRAALEALSKTYLRIPGATPFLLGSGRNAIDTEAYELSKHEMRKTGGE